MRWRQSRTPAHWDSFALRRPASAAQGSEPAGRKSRRIRDEGGGCNGNQSRRRSIEVQRGAPAFTHLPIEQGLAEWSSWAEEIDSEQLLNGTTAERLASPRSQKLVEKMRYVQDGERRIETNESAAHGSESAGVPSPELVTPVLDAFWWLPQVGKSVN